ncbi:uncharacterized protein B0H18DRAFT_1032224 [Fomitopsis serialis]|uniref:uncharacterized protein n=1 Tax=Fomitopsis serialis TaxID=139415 RepID=UPI0020072828|nr:uncharacterized protein B0H18DRAFT_1032224 [Neoantrodia serialis]KAH9918149.1 hypothetical protein B0H18DRAFT_1032224 [Neoantrodia serialis]
MTSDFQARNDSTERLDRLSASEYFAHFTRVDKPNDHILDILARDVWLEEVYRSNRTVVLRAWLAEVAKDEETANTVICKIARGDGALMRLEHEYHIYQYLEELQGSLIPKCFGIFRAEPTGAQGFDEACLLLEDCGRRMDKPIKDMSWQFRREVVAIVQRMHKIGVEHGDIFDYSENNGNILIRHIKFEGDGDSEHVVPCIIDFDNAKEHQCRVPMDISRRVWGVHSQRGRQFVCQEFIKIANDLDWVYRECLVHHRRRMKRLTI